jgi:hypothetical protein
MLETRTRSLPLDPHDCGAKGFDGVFRALRVSAQGGRWWLAIAVTAFLAALPSLDLFASQSQVKVRFLDPRSGKPLSKMWVTLTQYKGKPAAGPITADYVVSNTIAQTDQNGEISVTLHDPLPAFIQTQSFDLWNSGPLMTTREVLESGVVLNFSDKGVRSKPAPTAIPGVIIFVERRRTRWDRIRLEIP